MSQGSEEFVHLVLHVGPHKTGSTSAQAAFHEHRDLLRRHAILYPANLPDAKYDINHSDVAFMLHNNDLLGAETYVRNALNEACAAGCDTVLLSSEEFSAKDVRRQLTYLAEACRRRAQVTIVYVDRNPEESIVSYIDQFLTSEVGILYANSYDIRSFAERCLRDIGEGRSFFEQEGAVFVPLDEISPRRLAAEILQRGAGRDLPGLSCERRNVSHYKIIGQPSHLLSYPLRVMFAIINGSSTVTPAAYQAAANCIKGCVMDENAYVQLLQQWEDHVRQEVRLVVQAHEEPSVSCKSSCRTTGTETVTRRSRGEQWIMHKEAERESDLDAVNCGDIEAIREAVTSKVWFHSIDLGHGVVTQGQKTVAHLTRELDALQMPDLKGKTVLDIGAYDGFYSFEAERRGAESVVSLDLHAWEVETYFTDAYLAACREQGIPPMPPYKTEWLRWERKPEALPGKKKFDFVRRVLKSRVKPVVGDFMTTNPEQIGKCDVVLFLGVLYHLEDPLAGMRKVAELTGDVAIIETEAMEIRGCQHNAMCEFFPTNELNGDYSNWWSPNMKALTGLIQAAGFARSEVIQGAPQDGWKSAENHVIRYRAIVHAFK